MKPNLPMIPERPTSEIEIHYKRPLFETMFVIKSADDVNTCIRNYIHPKRLDVKEFFWILLLTNANRVIGISEIGSGTTEAVQVNIKEVCQIALKSNASALVLCHNHPSGKLQISKSDEILTSRVRKLTTILNIKLLDHLIITSESYLSFAQEGLL